MTRWVATAAAVVALVAPGACTRNAGMTLRSPAFENDRTIPGQFSCEGDNISPPLVWTRVPAEAAELALVVADPDAPSGTFHHWVVLGIAPKEGRVEAGELPPGAVEAKGGSENPTWIGPCPPAGEEHDYVFTLYALDKRLGLPAGADLDAALDAVDAARIDGEEATLEGRFGRPEDAP
ncbi:MAG TPA: YbhB/YbcL family Raf kinase inhibitor-like protein [Acidimicrobiales bacterium]|nr:YbhB/YbcL family Raf kinase inhibitor-like protein [Acidimicrobiales bacterium]